MPRGRLLRINVSVILYRVKQNDGLVDGTDVMRLAPLCRAIAWVVVPAGSQPAPAIRRFQLALKFVALPAGLMSQSSSAIGAQYYDTAHIDPSQLQPGDLVFFEPRSDGPGHVGMYVGDDVFIEAPHTGDVVKFARLSAEALKEGFVGATRPADGV